MILGLLLPLASAQQYWQFQQKQQQQQQQTGSFTTTCSTIYPTPTALSPSLMPQPTAVSPQPTGALSSSPYVMHVGENDYNPACPFYSGLPNFLISRNYSSIFHLASPSNATDEKSISASCAASQYCSERPPGLYCYRPPADPCAKQVEGCLPVAILSCPEAVFIGCAEGFACHQDREPWPWDLPVSQRFAYMAAFNQSQAQQAGPVKSSYRSQYQSPFGQIPIVQQPQLFPFTSFQVNLTQTNATAPQTNVTMPQTNMTAPSAGPPPTQQQQMAVAHCYAVLPDTEEGVQKSLQAAMLPNSPQDWSQWCSYRSQLKASSFNLSVRSDCMTRTLPGLKLERQQAAEIKCPESVSTVWWWPGMESGAPPSLPAKTATSLAISDPCILLPPPTCAGPYPYAPTTTATLVFVSPLTETASAPTQTVTMTSTGSIVTSTLPPVTVFETRTPPAVTVTQTTTATQTITPAPTTVSVTPAPVTITSAPAPVTPVPAVAATTAVEAGPTGAPPGPAPVKATAAVAGEAFPKAGEPYSVYTAKIGAIATVA